MLENGGWIDLEDICFVDRRWRQEQRGATSKASTSTQHHFRADVLFCVCCTSVGFGVFVLLRGTVLLLPRQVTCLKPPHKKRKEKKKKEKKRKKNGGSRRLNATRSENNSQVSVAASTPGLGLGKDLKDRGVGRWHVFERNQIIDY